MFDKLDDFYPALAAGEITEGTVVIFRYMGPRGAPGMPEMLGARVFSLCCARAGC